MNRNKINIATFFICGIISSCTGVCYDDLGNHYAWVESSRMIIKIQEKTENSLYGDIVIRPQVLNYDYDDNYIIAYQVYDGGLAYDSIQKVEEKDSLLIQFAKIKEMKHCYWIIDKGTDHVIGPMRKADFDRESRKLCVKAKMRHFHEKEFWEGMSIEHLDSIERKYK